MIVTFNPMINTGASADAAYMNFLRCVTAIMTAAAGTTTLTVNPFTNNTGTVDGTKNCIVSIDANTEAGGWTTSASHSIVSSGSFTSPTTTSQLYKADFYVANGKSAMPYNKITFTNWSPSTTTLFGTQSATTLALGWPTLPSVYIAYGVSTTSDLTNTNYVATTPGITASTQTSMVYNPIAGQTSSQLASVVPALNLANTGNYLRMAVTQNYCILWEVPNSNSYANGYSFRLAGVDPAIGNNYLSRSYGTLFYFGTRETQTWENSLNHNPPICSFQVQHVDKSGSSGFDIVAAYMATMTDTGVASSSSQQYFTQCTASTYTSVVTNTYASTSGITAFLAAMAAGTQTYTPGVSAVLNAGLTVPIFYNKDCSAYNYTQQFYMPVPDPNTGSLVPSAAPIIIRRYVSGSWNNGGACRGIYKSLSMPVSTMKLYFSNGQTFTIGSDTYIPVVFNETMYLIRNA
jgi:hypothetical protein